MSNIGLTYSDYDTFTRVQDRSECIHSFKAVEHYVECTMQANYWYSQAYDGLPLSQQATGKRLFMEGRARFYDRASGDGYKRITDLNTRECAENIGSETYNRRRNNGIKDTRDMLDIVHPEHAQARYIAECERWQDYDQLNDEMFAIYG